MCENPEQTQPTTYGKKAPWWLCHWHRVLLVGYFVGYVLWGFFWQSGRGNEPFTVWNYVALVGPVLLLPLIPKVWERKAGRFKVGPGAPALVVALSDFGAKVKSSLRSVELANVYDPVYAPGRWMMPRAYCEKMSDGAQRFAAAYTIACERLDFRRSALGHIVFVVYLLASTYVVADPRFLGHRSYWLAVYVIPLAILGFVVYCLPFDPLAFALRLCPDYEAAREFVQEAQVHSDLMRADDRMAAKLEKAWARHQRGLASTK